MNKPKLIIIAGPNGSGKTTITTQLLQHLWIEGCVYINPDNIAQDMFGDWNATGAIMQAAQYAQQQREECLRTTQSMAFETVLSTTDKLDFIIRAKAAGYFVRLFFIGTDSPTINIARIAQRIENGGHGVPMEKIITRYYKSLVNCAQIIDIIDRAYVYDNSIDNVAPQLLFRVADGKVKRCYVPIRAWAEEIYKKVE